VQPTHSGTRRRAEAGQIEWLKWPRCHGCTAVSPDMRCLDATRVCVGTMLSFDAGTSASRPKAPRLQYGVHQLRRLFSIVGKLADQRLDVVGPNPD
jgi:hypothetical protein